MNIPRFQEPDPEPKQNKPHYCQFCNECYDDDEMENIEYEVCKECLDGVVRDCRRHRLIVETVLLWANEGCEGSNYTAKLKLAAIKTYLDGL